MLPELRQDPCPAKTRADLEWSRLTDALAARCAGPLGKGLAVGLSFAPSRELARQWRDEAAEATALLAADRPLPAGEVDEVTEALERTRVGGVLSAGELRSVGRLLASARALRRFLGSRRGELPALYRACATDPTLDALAEEIEGAFDVDGTLADHASPRLGELRRELDVARRRLLARMEDLMGRYEGVLQDRFVTEREGRWVLPVRSDAHERFPGIVHATSASGSTLFVEPRAVIPMGNRLKVLAADVAREEEAVYGRLTSLVADALPSAEAAARALALADLRGATARLARDVELTFPEVVDEPRLDLRRARHVLLALDGPGVVPSDVALEAGKAIVVSGPNAGGKTVALKTLGLTALMVRAGLPVACDAGSVVGLFDVVLTDVGDDQSLQKNLSTFSAHVRNLAEILTETTRGALVLLDELAGGTDPREGEALAAGVLDSLCARGGAVAVTTHYEGLKALAVNDERFVNASVGFDLSTMTPTFKLAIGVPGSSSALAVARRYGLPSTVLERAERFITREDQSFEATVQRLQSERAALELSRAAADDRERQAAQALARLEVEIEQARSRERRALSEQAQELADRLQRARAELSEARARLRAKRVEPEAVRDAERALQRISGDLAVEGPLGELLAPPDAGPRPALSPAMIRKGTRVWVPKLRAEGEVVEVSASDARVAVGAMRVTVPVGDLRAAQAPEPAAARMPAKPARGAAAPVDDAPPLQTRDNTCDLRGLRVDDALAMATSFLDRAITGRDRAVFLLHGHGSGALRDALRKELARAPYVRHFRAAEPDRGGEGVTVVWLS